MIHIYKDLDFQDERCFQEIEALILSLDEGEELELERERVPAWVGKTKDHLMKNWNKPVSLEELSQLCGVHRVTISKYFAKYMGSTVRIYQRKIRIIRSLELIKLEKYSLPEVAFLCGFADQSHFTRFFRQTIGCLPKHLPKPQR